MKVLIFTETQKKQVEREYKNKSKLILIQDADNNFIFDTAIIDDDDFIEIRDLLLSLPQIEYKPIKTDEK
jgi:hypothetical protein